MYIEIDQGISYLDGVGFSHIFRFYANHFAGREIKYMGYDNLGCTFIQLESDLFNYFLAIKSCLAAEEAYIHLTHVETGETMTFDTFQDYKNFITKEGKL